MSFIRARLEKETFGLTLESPPGLLDLEHYGYPDIVALAKEFGFVSLLGLGKQSLICNNNDNDGGKMVFPDHQLTVSLQFEGGAWNCIVRSTS